MKKEYIVPSMKVKQLDLQQIMAASGPGAGDATLPGMTEDDDNGPGAGDFGGTPGFGGSRSNGTASFNSSQVWEEE